MLREKLEESHRNITKTQESLSRGEITARKATATLQRQNHWKSRKEGEIADIEFEIQHEGILPNHVQLTPGSAESGSIPPTNAGLLSQVDSSSSFTNNSSSAGTVYQMG